MAPPIIQIIDNETELRGVGEGEDVDADTIKDQEDGGKGRKAI